LTLTSLPYSLANYCHTLALIEIKVKAWSSTTSFSTHRERRMAMVATSTATPCIAVKQVPSIDIHLGYTEKSTSSRHEKFYKQEHMVSDPCIRHGKISFSNHPKSEKVVFTTKITAITYYSSKYLSLKHILERERIDQGQK